MLAAQATTAGRTVDDVWADLAVGGAAPSGYTVTSTITNEPAACPP